ncbi:MAG: T9SS type A sorting domain-containing protein [Bacteroidales bacterium]|nr:T9SS type A sorting domain-containing protein [Bacteroidales bacterium]
MALKLLVDNLLGMMKKYTLLFFALYWFSAFSQTTLNEAVDFHVKTIDGETIYLFPLLDDQQQVVVIDFFSTSCGPCQDYAPDFQACYEKFGSNQGNVYFMGLNWGNDNDGVREFDSIFGLTYPTVSGIQGGGNIVYGEYNILSYPTVVVITPDHQIVEQYIWLPDENNITEAVVNAGGVIVGLDERTLLGHQVNIFPQPANDFVNISLDITGMSNLTFDLYQLTGRRIFTQSFSTRVEGLEQFHIELPELTDGMYLLKISDDKGSITTRKVTVIN